MLTYCTFKCLKTPQSLFNILMSSILNFARQIHKCTHSEGPFYQDTVTTSGLRKSADKTKFKVYKTLKHYLVCEHLSLHYVRFS